MFISSCSSCCPVKVSARQCHDCSDMLFWGHCVRDGRKGRKGGRRGGGEGGATITESVQPHSVRTHTLVATRSRRIPLCQRQPIIVCGLHCFVLINAWSQYCVRFIRAIFLLRPTFLRLFSRVAFPSESLCAILVLSREIAAVATTIHLLSPLLLFISIKLLTQCHCHC